MLLFGLNAHTAGRSFDVGPWTLWPKASGYYLTGVAAQKLHPIMLVLLACSRGP